jgi:protein-tyrosine phosphatase
MGDAAPEVRSAGTDGWEGSGATPESIRAGAERGLDVAAHAARRLHPRMVDHADLVVTMTREHRREVVAVVPSAAPRTFTLKELTRLAEALPDPGNGDGLVERIRQADALRRTGFVAEGGDEDVADPLGMSLDTYRAIAWEIERFSERMADALLGRAGVTEREAG